MRDRDSKAVAGGPAPHVPVLGPAAIELLNVRDRGVYVDGTFGAGGHSRLILATPGARVIGIDRDQRAIAMGAGLVEASEGRLILSEDNFSDLDRVARELGFTAVDGVLLDVGVSWMQLDEAERGFSFRLDGPLDMRMGRGGPSAAEVVAVASERDLGAVIGTFGEERHARAVARAIVKARADAPIRTTAALAGIVSRVVRARPGDIHPATRTFQALRILVNDELGELACALAAAERVLKPGARLAVISFHSLEDRIAKNFFVARSGARAGSRHAPEAPQAPASFRTLTRRPIVADENEVARNPRARSAKLRAAERTDAPPIGSAVDLPPVPTLADLMKGR
jgi:16S rRNA (cytosine1402-N4)-methyltransferase